MLHLPQMCIRDRGDVVAPFGGGGCGHHAAGAASYHQHLSPALGGGGHAVEPGLLGGAAVVGAGQLVAGVQPGEAVQAPQAGHDVLWVAVALSLIHI